MPSFKNLGVYSVITLAKRMPVAKTDLIKILCKKDYLIQWKKPIRNKNSNYSLADREEILFRQTKATVNKTEPKSKTI